MEGAAKEDENGLHDMRVIVVANRLPISVSEDPKTGKWKYEMTSGGLVTALKGTRDEIDFIWIGWIGKQVPEEVRKSHPHKTPLLLLLLYSTAFHSPPLFVYLF